MGIIAWKKYPRAVQTQPCHFYREQVPYRYPNGKKLFRVIFTYEIPEDLSRENEKVPCTENNKVPHIFEL